jgi:hypothetical protein
MIDKNGSHLAPLAKEMALVLANETWHGGLQLINGYTLSWFGDCFDSGRLSFSPPWPLSSSAIKVGLTLGNPTGGQALWKLPSGCHDPDVFKGEMTKSAVPPHEL